MRVRYSFSSRKTGTIKGENRHKVAIPKVVKEVVELSDIILEVLDSRFIEETINKEIEEFILQKEKKIIYVLNKSDLVDAKKIKEKIAELNLNPSVFISCKSRIGIRELRNRISIEAKKFKKERVNIGVIGYPNTGKSSLINTLSGRNSAKTAAEAGFTKGIQKIRLKKGIILLDSPGLISENEDSTRNIKDLIKHAKINVRTYDKVKDPEFIVFSLIKQYPGVFEKFYNIPAEGDSQKLMEELGRRKNMLKKGNLVDIDRVSRLMLKEWQEGKIQI